jgi:hypothetical protein
MQFRSITSTPSESYGLLHLKDKCMAGKGDNMIIELSMYGSLTLTGMHSWQSSFLNSSKFFKQV